MQRPGGGVPGIRSRRHWDKNTVYSTFYVAAVVKPLFPFFSFPPLTSFLEELGHIVLMSLHPCLLVLRSTGMAMRVSPSQSSDDLYHHPWLNPAAPGHMTSMRLLASCGV